MKEMWIMMKQMARNILHAANVSTRIIYALQGFSVVCV